MIELPPWDDEKAWFQLLDAKRQEIDRAVYLSSLRPDDLLEMEQSAAAEARQGKFHGIADLIDPDRMLNRNPLPGEDRLLRERLSNDTWCLIAQCLRGEVRAKPGRPRENNDQRRTRSPVHDAAILVNKFELVLLHEWTLRQSRREIRERAIAFVARLKGCDRETLYRYMRRPRSDRRRLRGK